MAMESQRWDGKQITKAGIYAGLRIEHYHARNICLGPSISSSGLRKIASKSPLHFWDTSSMNPDAEEEDVPRHFILGRAMHHLALGEANFAKVFAVAPDQIANAKGVLVDWSGRTDNAKAWMAARQKEGRIVLYPKEVEQIRCMAQALARNPYVSQQGILAGHVERSAFWKDKETNIWLKVRPDVIPTDGGDCVDLKTTTSVLWHDLTRTIYECGYHQQFALMREGFRALGLEFHSATLFFIEKVRPYATRVIELNDKWLDLGERQNRAALRTFAQCLNKGIWPGPGEDRGVESMGVPEWVKQASDKPTAGESNV